MHSVPDTDTDAGSRPRTPLSSRLHNLLRPGPRSSLDSERSSRSTGENASMWRVYRTTVASRSQTSLTHTHAPQRTEGIPPRVESTPALLPLDLAQSATQHPVLRWFRGKSSPRSPRSPRSPVSTSPSSPPSALREALEDDIPCLSPDDMYSLTPDFQLQRPPPARLPAHMPGRAAVRRSPPFLESLARSALPTASVTRPPPALRQPTDHTLVPSEDGVDEPCIDITQSPPVRSSLDSLRQLQDRNNPAIPPGIPGTSKPRSLSSSSGPSRWWFGGDRKADVDELLDESDQADTIEGEEAHLRKKYRAPKNPVVFCHGLLGFDSVQIGPAIAPMSVSHWRGIKEVLEARGIEVLITRVPATSSPVERAKVLEAKVSEVYPGRAVHLIGHSMGGLDCRYLTTHLTQRKFRVLSITTVATPHRGSSFADHFIATVGKQRIPSFVSLLDLLPNGGGDGKAFESLTLGAMRRFNEETPDVEGVKYFSWGAVFDPGLIDAFKWPHSVIMEKEGPNDGLVSVASSKWGTYLGTLEDVNHLDLVGWINTARYKWAEFTGREIKFKPATFYLGVADHLARHVEGQERVPSSAGGSRRPSEEDVVAAEHSKAGKGVSTVEGVEHQGPRTPPDEGESSSDRLDVRIPMPDSSSSRRRSSS